MYAWFIPLQFSVFLWDLNGLVLLESCISHLKTFLLDNYIVHSSFVLIEVICWVWAGSIFSRSLASHLTKLRMVCFPTFVYFVLWFFSFPNFHLCLSFVCYFFRELVVTSTQNHWIKSCFLKLAFLLNFGIQWYSYNLKFFNISLMLNKSIIQRSSFNVTI